MNILKSGTIWGNEQAQGVGDDIGGGMAHSPERLCGGTGVRLCGGINPWGGGRAWAATPSADGSGPASAGSGNGLAARRLGLAWAMDMGTRALGLSAPSLRPLGIRSLVA
ncbi:MAG: hypothetical protein ACYCRF_07865 [Acidithiobacillus sp.]